MEPQTFFKHQTKTRRQITAKRLRSEAAVLKAVRADVFARDGGCRMAHDGIRAAIGIRVLTTCSGPLTLAHLPPYRRSQTRRKPAHERHDARWCVTACAYHHAREEAHEIRHRYLTSAMAAGPMAWEAA